MQNYRAVFNFNDKVKETVNLEALSVEDATAFLMQKYSPFFKIKGDNEFITIEIFLELAVSPIGRIVIPTYERND